MRPTVPEATFKDYGKIKKEVQTTTLSESLRKDRIISENKKKNETTLDHCIKFSVSLLLVYVSVQNDTLFYKVCRQNELLSEQLVEHFKDISK